VTLTLLPNGQPTHHGYLSDDSKCGYHSLVFGLRLFFFLSWTVWLCGFETIETIPIVVAGMIV
jgi:hypothetical protein